jgi:integrase
MNIQQQSESFLLRLENRRRNPGRPSTLSAYRSYIRKWIIPQLGEVELGDVKNAAVRNFVVELGKADLAPATIGSILCILKEIVASAVNEDGDLLYPRQWNTDFIDAPIVNQKDQRAPIIGRSDLQTALGRSQGQFKTLYALLAGTGLRVSESMALRAGEDDNEGSFWLPGQSKLIIRGQRRLGVVAETKTPAGMREIDLVPELNDFLRTRISLNGKFLFNDTNLFRRAKASGIPGHHSFRRFRATHLNAENVPTGLIQFWLGHSAKTTTDRYIRVGSDIEARRTWCIRAGLGFELPRE